MGIFTQKRQPFQVLNGILALFSAILLMACATYVEPPNLIDGAPEDDVLEIIPYVIDESERIIVKVMVNDTGPYDFILDTAATRTLIFENVRQALDLEFSTKATTFVHGALLRRQRPALPLQSIKIGSLELNNFRSFSLPDLATIGDAPMLGGVLGNDFMSLYALYFNVTDQRIVFAKSGYVPDRRKYVAVPIRFNDLGFLEQGLPFVSASVQGKPLEALIDLGSSATVINWAAVSSFGVNVERHLSDRFKFQGVFSEIPIRSRAEGTSIAIGKRVWREQGIEVVNLSIFDTMQRGELPTLIVSATLLRDKDFIIDFPNLTLYLEADRSQRLRRATHEKIYCRSDEGLTNLCPD